MKIVVCIKQGIDVKFPFLLDQEKLVPLEEDLFPMVSLTDRCAVEMALAIKEQHGAEVTLLAFGPPAVEKALRDCLAMGGGRAVRVWEEGIDPASQAKHFLLAMAIDRLSPDLVLCGGKTPDAGSGETPPAVAEYLGFCQGMEVTSLELSPDRTRVVVQRKLERGKRETMECPLPAVLAVESGIRQPRYAPLPLLLEAHQAQIECITGHDLGIDPFELRRLDRLRTTVRRSLPRPRPKKTFTMESGLTAEQRMELMMSGGSRQGKSDMLEGPPFDLAKRLTEILTEKIVRR